MKVNIKFFCREVVGNARAGEYEVKDGALLSELMDQAARQNGTFVDEYMNHMIFLVNSRPAQPDAVLSEADTVTVLRKAYGG